ncbi:MAG: PD-(D/E)XK nuclease family protein [Putridiphycobacter sp.]
MNPFLQQVAQKILNAHQSDLADITIIIPNKRAAVYLQKHFSTLIQKPFFAPKITTINEWIDEYTPIEIISQTELLFVFYEVFVEVEKEYSRVKVDEIESFDSFIKWGKMILSDFDEIDRYLISPKEIFRDLRNIKDIEQWDLWSFNPNQIKNESGQLSNSQQQFLDLWDKLPIYYQRLNEKLEALKLTYQGRAYQNFAKKTTLVNPTASKHIYFVGFNALSESEIKIIENLKNQKLSTVFFDVDPFYIQNKEHEAGHFYRKLKDRWHINETLEEKINAEPKHIEIIETAQQVAQAKIAGHIIKNIKSENLKNTAIILADESLLIPITKSLPSEIDTANITMGYPIKYTHLKSLFDLVFDFQFNQKKFKNEKHIYHKTLLKFIDHPYIQMLINDVQKIADFESELIEKNIIFIPFDTLIEKFPNLISIKALLMIWFDDIAKGFGAIENFIQVLYNGFKESNHKDLELELLYHFSKGIERFKKIWVKYPYPLDLKSFKKLFDQFWQNQSLSFLGNPIEGVQIMGVLESRTLDFENVIITSLNEGNLPQSNFNNSLIPYELKRHHQLPVESDRDAIFAHHFYRLLHQAKNLFFIYNSSPDGFSNSEKSRFITQIENELNLSKVAHNIQHFTYSAEDLQSDISETSYQLTESVEQKLDQLFQKGLSPSALNTFINCPLDFYYKYVLGLREDNEVEENVEASTFGTFIHEVLEQVFKSNFLDPKKVVSPEVLEKEKKNLKHYLKTQYLLKFSENDIKYGQNKLSFEVSLDLLEKFMDSQIKELKANPDKPIYIKALETTIEADFDWEIHGKNKRIKIKGNADRIDQFGSTYRIIDYKSGKCTTDKVSIAKPKKGSPLSLKTIINSDTKGYARQLLMYALMFEQTFPEYDNFSAGIISMINIKDWLQNVKVSGSDTTVLNEEILELFKEELKTVVEKMYDPSFEFVHNSKSKYCEYCGV